MAHVETANRVELDGIVGTVCLQEILGKTRAHFTVATSMMVPDDSGDSGGPPKPRVEVSWFSVVAWEAEGVDPLDELRQGCEVHLVGRLRQLGNTYEVVAHKLSITKGI